MEQGQKVAIIFNKLNQEISWTGHISALYSDVSYDVVIPVTSGSCPSFDITWPFIAPKGWETEDTSCYICQVI